ncbi:MAG: GerMN domain-containing protein [Vicinamibacteria bacterium]
MRRAEVSAVLALVGLLTALAASAPSWGRLLRRSGAAGLPAGSDADAAPRPAASEAGRRISVKLFFVDTELPLLVEEERAVAFSSELSQQLLTVVRELVAGSTSGRLAPLPPETRVLAVFVTARGDAFVDLSPEALAPGGDGGSLAERLRVYALVNSITANFPAIRRVQILVEDKPVLTLSGHLDLSRPLPPDLTLIAAPEPVPIPQEAPVAAASVAPTPVPSASPR